MKNQKNTTQGQKASITTNELTKALFEDNQPERGVLAFLGFFNRAPEYPKKAKRSTQKHYEQHMI